jgi:hypothetical protein
MNVKIQGNVFKIIHNAQENEFVCVLDVILDNDVILLEMDLVYHLMLF